MNTGLPCPNYDPLRLVLRLQSPPPGGWRKVLRDGDRDRFTSDEAAEGARLEILVKYVVPPLMLSPGFRAFITKYGFDSFGINGEWELATHDELVIYLTFESASRRAEYVLMAGGFGRREVVFGKSF